MKLRITLFLLLTPYLFNSYCQEITNDNKGPNPTNEEETNSEVESLMAKGNKLLGKGDFYSALPVWLKLVKDDPENSNINFKLGLCYHNSQDKQTKALPYFINAVKSLTGNYNFTSLEERNAPNDAIYFLAEAYRASNQPDHALKHYLIYKDQHEGAPPIRVDEKIRECMNAQKMLKAPLNVKYANAGETVNTGFYEASPVVSIDNNLIFFASARLRKDESNKNKVDPETNRYFTDIYLAQSNGAGGWKKAKLFEHTASGNEAPLCISSDSKTLFFCREEKGETNLYETTLESGIWSPPTQLGSNINSSFDDTGLTLSPDGNTLYFTSTREGGHGKADIYRATKNADGTWGKASNMGKLVNSSGNELNPFMHPNGKKLYFSSDGWHTKGMGGNDIYFIAMQEDGSWSPPQNIGYPINSMRDDMHFYVAANGQRYCTAISDNFNYDIYSLEEGQFDKANLKPGTVIELQTELEVMDIIELEKEVEKEIEVTEIVEVETEVEKEIEIEKEVEVVEIIEVEKDPAFAKARAEEAKARAEEAKALAEIKMAEATKAKSEADIITAQAEIKKAEADKIAAEAQLAEANAKIKEAEAKIADSEKAKAEREKARDELKKAKMYRKAAKDSARLADVNIERAKAKAAVAEERKVAAAAEKANAEAQKKKAEANIAAAEKAKADAEKAKADATIAAAQKAEMDASIAKEEKEKAILDTEKAKADAEKAASDAVIAAAETARSEEEKAKADQATSEANAMAAKAEENTAKSEAKKAEEEAKAKDAEARIAASNAENAKQKAEEAALKQQIAADEKAASEAKAQTTADEKAKASAEAETARSKADEAKSIADQEKAATEKARLAAMEQEEAAKKATADASRAASEEKAQAAAAEKAIAEADKAKAKEAAENAAAQKATAEADKAKAVAEEAKAKEAAEKAAAQKAAAEAEKAKAVEEEAKAKEATEKAAAQKAADEAEKAKSELEKAKLQPKEPNNE